ncbi:MULTISPECIES: hypothetical protein [Bizionia]|uniref:Uncharacterized protein n=1 Tax=Bizionia algoritergicola TaxID=291187 RepID=A0A5D0QW34_9FLAO|nr:MULTISPECIES: hypothetical protein [Bizionia]OBX23422.1 hypothetical protein BAA08_05045 [Bizionia sp. APA-3]TYB73417.1 hypothetical protein ES675_07080 [Bizionia algoritergicola]
MNHKYYLKTQKEQNQIQLKIGLAAFLVNLIVFALSIFSGLYILFLLSVAVTLSIIAPFFDIPALKKSGKLIYYSSLFVAEKELNAQIIIHGGSLFDYVFVIDRNLNGKQRTQFILQKYLEGILNLIDAYEKSDDTTIKIKGTTYFLNERTANKIGLKVVKTDFFQKVILIYNYVNLLISNSIAKGKLAFPKLTHIKTFEGELQQLINRKKYLKALHNKLKSSIFQDTLPKNQF